MSMKDFLNRRDLLASVVVFLVALPLCMGIAIASGVPPARGLVTGIIGGIVTGYLAGSPLQVSGPAAGLTVLVYELVSTYGSGWLGIAVAGAGILQWLAGRLGFGRVFQAVSPAVVKGMLAGIGVLIFASQFHVLVDDKPRKSGLDNLLSIPEAIMKGVAPSEDTVHHLAAMIGLVALLDLQSGYLSLHRGGCFHRLGRDVAGGDSGRRDARRSADRLQPRAQGPGDR